MPKITVYTINNCPFCEQAKTYLTEHKLLFEEKNIDANRAYLSEMLAVSDNFAGVPFTVVQKDDGSSVKLKGFTKEDFDQALAVIPVPVAADEKAAFHQPVPFEQTPVIPTQASQPPPQQEPSTPSTVPVPAEVPPIPVPIPSPAVSTPPPEPPTPTPAPASQGEPVSPAPSEVVAPAPSMPSTAPTPTIPEPASQGEPVTIGTSPSANDNHNQKLQDILSNLQKISGMPSEPAATAGTPSPVTHPLSSPTAPEPSSSTPSPAIPASEPASQGEPAAQGEPVTAPEPVVPTPTQVPPPAAPLSTSGTMPPISTPRQPLSDPAPLPQGSSITPSPAAVSSAPPIIPDFPKE